MKNWDILMKYDMLVYTVLIFVKHKKSWLLYCLKFQSGGYYNFLLQIVLWTLILPNYYLFGKMLSFLLWTQQLCLNPVKSMVKTVYR